MGILAGARFPPAPVGTIGLCRDIFWPLVWALYPRIVIHKIVYPMDP